jgi:hypothetical protein
MHSFVWQIAARTMLCDGATFKLIVHVSCPSLTSTKAVCCPPEAINGIETPLMASGGSPLDTVIAMLMLSPPAKRILHDAYKQEENHSSTFWPPSELATCSV